MFLYNYTSWGDLFFSCITKGDTFCTWKPPPSPCGRCYPLLVKRLARWAGRRRRTSPAAGPPPSSGTSAASPLLPESLADLTGTFSPAPPAVSPGSWTPGVPPPSPSCWLQYPPLGSSSPAQCSSFPPPGRLTAVWWKWSHTWEGARGNLQWLWLELLNLANFLFGLDENIKLKLN